MTEQVTKVRVFVSSPGDVQRESDSLFDVREEINTTLGQELGFVVEVVQWKTHCLPAMGRPQGVINEQIGAYDIFIGIMWKRFGTPTGEAESGTEEEFNLAFEEWTRDTRLEVLFYFSGDKYTLNSKAEAEQLNKVLEFKNELKMKGLVWEYTSASVFADVVRPHLSRVLLRMFRPKTASEASVGVIDRPPPARDVPNEQAQQADDTALTEPVTKERQTGEQQIVESVSALESSVGREGFANGVRFAGDLSDFQLLRLQLLASTWLAAHLPSSMLDTHEANRLFLSRETLRLTSPEYVSLLRMLVSDPFGYIPGWYWFREFEEADIETVILDLAFSDPHNPVRQKGFELLSSASVPLDDGAQEGIARAVAHDSSPDVRKAALSYIGSNGTQAYLSVVEMGLEDHENQVSYQAKISKFLLLARLEPDRSMTELLSEPAAYVDDILEELRPRAGAIATPTLLRALDDFNDDIRFFAIKELIRRRELTIELATARREDKYDPTKAVAYRFLIEQGAEIDDEDMAWKLPHDYVRRLANRNLLRRSRPPIDREQVVLEFYQRFTTDQLEQMANWNRVAGHEAYRALAIEHFPEVGENIRRDLQTDFAEDAEGYYRARLEEWRRIATTVPSIENLSLIMPSRLMLLSGLKQEPAEQAKQTLENIAQSDVAGRKVYYIWAALAGLAAHGSAGDAEFGRRFLSHSDNDVRIEAARLLGRCGNADDVDRLVELAKSSDGLLQEIAAQNALALSSESNTAEKFLATNDEILISITVAMLILQEDRSEASNFLKPYLYNDNEKIRTRVMTFFAISYDSRELADLLDLYTSEPVYYYDVVCFFDRTLYSPPRLRSFYRKAAEAKFFGLLSLHSES